jgi:hypothetical protein
MDSSTIASWVIYLIFVVLGFGIMALTARFLVVLTRFLRTLDAYWRLKTAKLYAEQGDNITNE